MTVKIWREIRFKQRKKQMPMCRSGHEPGTSEKQDSE